MLWNLMHDKRPIKDGIIMRFQKKKAPIYYLQSSNINEYAPISPSLPAPKKNNK